MTFPKFTSGGSGRLTFDVMNDLFSRVEKLEAASAGDRFSLRDQSEIFFARVGTQNGTTNEWSFAEVARKTNTASLPSYDPTAWDTISGRTSTGQSGANVSSFRYPLIASGVSTGQILPIIASATMTGDLCYIPVEASAGSTTFPARITASTSIATNRWSYACNRSIVDTSNAFVDASPVQTITAYNGAESVSDSSPIFGVGMQPPTSATLQMIRQPIRNNVVVMVTEVGGKYAFSMPNGYRVIC